MSLTEICFWGVYLGGLCAAVAHPIVGVGLYVLVYHLNPEYQWWGGNVHALGLRTSFTIAVATFIGVLLRRPRLEHGAAQFPPAVLGMLALAAYAALSLTWSGFGERSVQQLEKFLKIAVFTLLLVRCVRRPEHYHLVILAWLWGVFYVGYQAWGNVGLRYGGRLVEGLGGPDFAESSDLAAHLIATLPLVGAMIFTARTHLGRLFYLATGALAVNTIIMTRTRNAIVGFVAIAVTALVSLPRGYRLKGWAGMALGTLLATQLADPGWWRRMSTIAQYETDASSLSRITFWRAAIQMAKDQPLGIGVGAFQDRVREYVPGLQTVRSAHNTFLECLAELGVPGFLTLAGVLGSVFFALWRVQRRARQYPSDRVARCGPTRVRFHLGWHATALRVGLAGYLTCGLFTTRLFAEDLWLLLGLSVALVNVDRYCRGECAATDAERAPEAPSFAGAWNTGQGAPAHA